MAAGVQAAAKVPGILRISAGNYGGKLGQYRADLKEVLTMQAIV
jgi:formylmethanofuran--tetrahydromethanopterin N-formyltransferase